MKEYFEKFLYKLGELEQPKDYVEKYGERYDFTIYNEEHRRYYVGNNRINYKLKGKGVLYLYYGENFSYENIEVDGDYTIYTLITPDKFCYIHRDIKVKGSLILRTVGLGGYIEMTNNIDIMEKSNVNDIGVGFVKDDQLAIYRSILNHKMPGSTSYSHYRGISNDQATIRLEGFINILPGASNTNSFLDEHVMLLNDNANAFTFPALKIENNDVKASHSATISKIPEEMLIYLESRGIDRKDAVSILINGFLNSVMEVDIDISEYIRLD